MRTYLATVLAVAVLAASGWRLHVLREGGKKHRRHRLRIEDQSSLRGIAMSLDAQRLPMKDGVLDPYDLVRSGKLVREQYHCLRSVRFGGPTDKEIEGGDYTNFPWERYRGDPSRPLVPRFPLLWGRPDTKGRRVVGFSDGSVEVVQPERLDQWGLDR